MQVEDNSLRILMLKIKDSRDEALRNYFDTGDREMLGEYKAYVRAANIISEEIKCSD